MPNTNSQRFSTRDICCIALVSAACVVGRTLFQFIPNFQPMTDMFILISLYKGMKNGILVCILSIVITNIYMGMGIWTLFQIISFSIIIIATFFCSKSFFFRKHLSVQLIYAVFCGYLYGFLISYMFASVYAIPNFFVYYIQGLSFDSLHALGNGLFYPLLRPIIQFFFNRYWKPTYF